MSIICNTYCTYIYIIVICNFYISWHIWYCVIMMKYTESVTLRLPHSGCGTESFWIHAETEDDRSFFLKERTTGIVATPSQTKKWTSVSGQDHNEDYVLVCRQVTKCRQSKLSCLLFLRFRAFTSFTSFTGDRFGDGFGDRRLCGDLQVSELHFRL